MGAGYTPSQLRSIQHIVWVSSSLSIVGALAIVCLYVYYKGYKQFHLKTILCLNIADFLTAVLFLAHFIWVESGPSMKVGSITASCDVLDTLVQGALVSSFMWTCNLSHLLWSVVVRKRDTVARHGVIYHVLGWGIPVIFTVAMCIRDARLGCDLSPGKDFLLSFYPILIVALIYNLCVYIWMSLHLRRNHDALNNAWHVESTSRRRPKSRLQTSFAWFVWTFVGCWCWGICINVIRLYRDVPIWMIYVHYVVAPLQGFIISIVYGFNDEMTVRKAQRLLCCTASVDGPARYSDHPALIGDGSRAAKRIQEVGYDWIAAYEDDDSASGTSVWAATPDGTMPIPRDSVTQSLLDRDSLAVDLSLRWSGRSHEDGDENGPAEPRLDDFEEDEDDSLDGDGTFDYA